MTTFQLTDKEVPTKAQMVEIIKAATGENQVRNRALIAFEYMTGGRVSEIVKRVRKMNLDLGIEDGRDYLFVSNFHTLKNRKHPSRKLPIPIYMEMDIYKFLEDYVKPLNNNDILFDFSRWTAWKIVSTTLRKFKNPSKALASKGGGRFMNSNHFFRHTRNSHLVSYYKFTDQQLVQWNGWSDSKPATRYMHLRTSGLIDSFRRAEG